MTHPRPSRIRLAMVSLATAAWLIPRTGLHAIGVVLSRPPRRDERGDVIVQHLGIILLSIVALVAIFAALKLLGTDVIAKVRSELQL